MTHPNMKSESPVPAVRRALVVAAAFVNGFANSQ
jgi:hypothetical protein